MGFDAKKVLASLRMAPERFGGRDDEEARGRMLERLKFLRSKQLREAKAVAIARTD